MPSKLLFFPQPLRHSPSNYRFTSLETDRLFSQRRLIGRRFDDPTVKKDMESWPFKVLDDAGQPKIEVDYLGEKKSFSAQEISSMVLLKV